MMKLEPMPRAIKGPNPMSHDTLSINKENIGLSNRAVNWGHWVVQNGGCRSMAIRTHLASGFRIAFEQPSSLPTLNARLHRTPQAGSFLNKLLDKELLTAAGMPRMLRKKPYGKHAWLTRAPLFRAARAS